MNLPLSCFFINIKTIDLLVKVPLQRGIKRTETTSIDYSDYLVKKSICLYTNVNISSMGFVSMLYLYLNVYT